MSGKISGRAASRDRPARVPDRLALARLAVSAAVSLGLALLVWTSRPDTLTAPIDVVGYPTFANFNYIPILWGWRIVVLQVPLVAVVAYTLLRRFGPLASPRPAGPLCVDVPTPAGVPDRPRVSVVGTWVSALAVPAGLVAYATSTLQTRPGGTWTTAGLLAGASYAALVVLLVVLVRRRRPAWTPTAALCATSAVAGCLVGIGAPAVASRRTIALHLDGVVTHWGWFAWWLAVPLAGLLLALVVRGLRRGADPVLLERRIRTWLLGSVAVFVLTASLPPALTHFEGFDDSQSVLGADLLTRGFFPWRDFIFIHGLFEDGLRSSVGFALFEPSIWGALGSYSLVFAPLFWVLLYLLAVYAAPRASVVPVTVVVLAASFAYPVSTRWVLIGAGFLVLAEALRRRTWPWTAALTALLFVDAVLVPEASLQVIASFAVLVLSDLTHRTPGRAWWRSLSSVGVFVTTGAALSAVFLGFLALHGALGAFVRYYVYFGPGHNESGTLPLAIGDRSDFVTMTVLAVTVIATMGWLFSRWLAAGTLSPLQWTTLAAALVAGVYGEKGLGRFDLGHIVQTVNVALPLYILVVAQVIGAADGYLRDRLHGGQRPGLLRTLGQPAACAAVVVVALGYGVHAVGRVPSNLQMVVPGPTTLPKVGYMEPGAVNEVLLDDLDSILDTYAGPHGDVFDFTNSPGYVYYLLGRDPGTSFVHISMAAGELAQQEVVDELSRSRPPVVVFDNTIFGIPSWDGPRAEVRHFEVAQYLLDHWTPVIAADGVLFLIRDDLAADAPAPPTLSAEPDTSDLYFSQPTCDFGYTANYVESPPTGREVDLPVRQRDALQIQLNGWAYDQTAGAKVPEVVVAAGRRVVGRIPADGDRPDVAATLGVPEAAGSGFSGSLVFQSNPRMGPLAVFGLVGGKAYVVSPPEGYQAPTSLTDGDRTIPVVEGHAVGVLEALEGSPTRVGVARVPAGERLSDYELATFGSDGPIGQSTFTVTDRFGPTTGPGINRLVGVGVLPSAGADIAVRVGSCLQWHGFDGRELVITQDGGRPISRIVLSGVAD